MDFSDNIKSSENVIYICMPLSLYAQLYTTSTSIDSHYTKRLKLLYFESLFLAPYIKFKRCQENLFVVTTEELS